MLVLVPVALFVLAGLLALASHLEQRRTHVLVRLTVRSKSVGPETSEHLIAEELAPLLANAGLARRSA